MVAVGALVQLAVGVLDGRIVGVSVGMSIAVTVLEASARGCVWPKEGHRAFALYG
jgi:hypothetical protein